MAGGAQPLQHLKAAHLRHAHVQQHCIGGALHHPLQTLLAAAHRGHHVDAAPLQQFGEADTEQGVIVYDQNAHH